MTAIDAGVSKRSVRAVRGGWQPTIAVAAAAEARSEREVSVYSSRRARIGSSRTARVAGSAAAATQAATMITTLAR